MSRAASLCAVAIVLSLCGCSEPAVGNAVTGTVTFHGQPLDHGTIEFSPAAGQGTMSGGPIQDGQYAIPGAKGLEPGAYDVRISSREGSPTAKDEMPGELKSPPKERIPAQFNSETTLKAEVKASGENRFDYTIP